MSALRSASKKDRLNQALAVLNKIAQTLIATQDLSGMLQTIAQNARDVLRADIVDLYEYIQTANEFVLPPVLVGARRHRHIPKVKIYDDDVVMKVVKAGKPKYFPDAQAATLLTGKFKVKRADAPDKRFVAREGVLSSVSIPLRAGRETVGIMFVNYRTKQSFNDEQKNLIESFSNLAAIAIYNARLYKAEYERRELSDFQTQALDRLSRLSQRLVSIREEHEDVSGLLDEVARSAKEVLRADIIELYEYSQAKKSYQLPQISVGERIGPFVPKQEIYEDDSILLLIDRDGPSYIENSQVDDSIASDYSVVRADMPAERFAIRENIQSTAAIPLKVGDEPVGLMFANYRTKQDFTAEQKELIELFANQSAIAIYNARLYRAERDRRQALARLSQLSQRLVSIREEHKNVRDFLHEIAQSAKEVLEADIIELYEYLHSKRSYKLPQISIGESVGPLVSKQEIYEDDVVLRLIDRAQPSYIEDSQADDSIGSDYKIIRANMPTERFAIREKIQSTAAVPLKAGDEPVGLMFANYRIKQEFTTEQKELIELFANQAAIAIQNARLYKGLDELVKERTGQLEDANYRLDEINQRLEILIDFGQKLTSGIRLREDEILNLIHKEASGLMDTQNMYIALYDKEKDEVRFGLAFYSGNRIDVKTEPSWQPRKAGKGKTEEIIRTKKFLFHKTKQEAEEWYAEPGHKEYVGKASPSWIGVPIISGFEVLGVIATYHPTEDNVYDQDDLKILQGIADQAVVALDNAHLYYEVNTKLRNAIEELERTHEQRLWAEIGKTAGSLAHRIGNKGGIIRVTITDLFEDLKSNGIEDEIIINKLKMIERNNQYLLEMSDLLFKPVDATKKDLEKANIILLVADAIRSIDIPNDVEIDIPSAIDELPQVRVNRSFVEIFVEIINNALEAMKSSPVKRILIDGQIVGKFVEISFQDTGPGISEEDQETLFDLFDRLPDNREGVGKHRGFGLWWVKSFLSSIGGDLLCKSAPGEGARFIIQIPL
jgi:GAF domain-containing protein